MMGKRNKEEEKIRDPEKIALLRRVSGRFPPYVWITFILVLSLQMLVFYGTRIPLSSMTLHNLDTPLDAMIPFLPEWVVIYFWSYLSWVVGVILIVAESKEHGYRFAAAYVLALLISCAAFLIWPATMTRPEVTGEGFFRDWMRFLYRVDTPTNLCPSLHVWISYLCFRGTIGCRTIPRWYKIYRFVFLVLVCFSILFVKQHVLIDIPAALATGEISMQLSSAFRMERVLFGLEKILKKRKRS